LAIARNLTPELQGFYYTFGSLLALQTFVELAFYVVVISASSHEWAHLRLDESGRIVGDSNSLSRLISLGRLVFRWYAVASIVFVIVVGSAGYLFFSRQGHVGVDWRTPWFVLVILTGILLWALPFNSILEGCNQVATINRFRLTQTLLSTVALWLSLLLGWRLWAVVISAGVGVLRDLYLLLIQYRRFFKPFFTLPIGTRMHWRNEIWPMQWRLALSGVANYFAFSLFNPIMFYYHGAVVAGQMGMTWSIVTSVQALALIWVQTKVPRFGMLIAKKQYEDLDRFWLRSSLVSLLVLCAGAGSSFVLVYTLNVLRIPLAERLLPPLPMGFFLLAAVFMQVSQCQSAYLRAHKQEPIMVLSVTSSLLIGLAVWELGRRFGPNGAAVGFLAVIAVLAVPWETAIWFRCRAKWHSS
jgi:O-antigen/teichoic acid export membrane protein